MNKIFFTAISAAALLLASCDLDREPSTVLRDKDAATIEHIEAVSAGLYNGLKSVTSGQYYYNADYHTDVFFETKSSANRGGYFASWQLLAGNSDINAMWSGYYALVDRASYALYLLDRIEAKDSDGTYADKIAYYRAEAHLFRAYFMHQIALRFCEDYDPATADTTPGVPCPPEHNPDAQLPRGTLAQTYKFILDDIEAAAELENYEGEPDSFYLSKDALTAFKAQVALQMHNYDAASDYASSLYDKYPLIDSADDLEKMWRDDISTETILRLEVNSSTNLGSVSAMNDYYNGSWSASEGRFLCQPAYVLSAEAAAAFDADNDWRYGIYVNEEAVSYSAEVLEGGILMTKFLGNRAFQTSEKVYMYRNMPKVFRIAEMYLIDAEAQYNLGGDALTPLNALRESRGLDALSVSGDELLKEIKLERMREMIGEGHRLTDLKRWGDGFYVNPQPAFKTYVRREVVVVDAGDYQFVWPIPQEEISNNRNISDSDQNPGY